MPSKKATAKAKKAPQAKYLVAIGRRKTATARVRLYPHKKGEIEVNNQPIQEYFPGKVREALYSSPLRTCNVIGKYLITVKVQGSGKAGQLVAVIHGLAR